MTNSLQPTETMHSVAAILLTQDEELRRMAEQLFRKALKQMEYTLKWGTAAERASLNRVMLTVLFKGLSNIRGKEQDINEKEAYDNLRAALAESLTSVNEVH